MMITQFTKDVIAGMLISDGYLPIPKRCVNAVLKIQQANLPFTTNLYDIFKSDNLVGTAKILTRKRFDKRTNNFYTSYSFQTLTNLYLTELHKMWYIEVNNKKIKIIPDNISELLSDVALAYWLMGDGTFHKTHKYINLCTHSFRIIDVVKLQNALLERKINSSIQAVSGTQKEQYILHIMKDSVPLFSEKVFPFLISEMYYKIGY